MEEVSQNVTKCSSGGDGSLPYSIPEMVLIAFFTGTLSLITVIGNCMVMISFKIDKQLQTISNYFLFSLAVADFAIGLISMPLFTVSTILGYWPLGRHICDTWLALDYLASNASVLNLLIISFDRYFSVTRPLTYRAKRTTSKAAFMIGCAWGISLLLWPPWIYAWPYIEGKRTVPETECYIQFIETNHYITFGTAIAAFYVPVTVMCTLYWRIWRETKKRQKDLPNLQAGKRDSTKRSRSSEDPADSRGRRRSKDDDEISTSFDCGFLSHSGTRRKSRKRRQKARPFTWAWIKYWCTSWWRSGREEEGEEPEETLSDLGYITPLSVDTPLQPNVTKCTSLNEPRDPDASQPSTSRTHRVMIHSSEPQSVPSTSKQTSDSTPDDSIYTILIRLPKGKGDGSDPADLPSIKMIENDKPVIIKGGLVIPPKPVIKVDKSTTMGLDYSKFAGGSAAKRSSKVPLSTRLLSKHLPGTLKLYQINVSKAQPKKKKKAQEKKQDRKAARTLTAILLSFIITWTPYNVLVLLKPVTTGYACIPQALWDFFYYLCYINSTINPVCYALCNASFRRTYVRILTCKWQSRNRMARNRGFFN